MKKTNLIKSSLLMSFGSILVLSLLFVGLTYAWFTGESRNTGNKIESGNLDVSLLRDFGSGYVDISGDSNPIFKIEKWEPGLSEEVELIVKNTGNIKISYSVSFQGLEKLDPAVTKNIDSMIEVSVDGVLVGTLDQFKDGTKELLSGTLEEGLSKVFTIKLRFIESADNSFKGAKLDQFDVLVIATQALKETLENGN